MYSYSVYSCTLRYCVACNNVLPQMCAELVRRLEHRCVVSGWQRVHQQDRLGKNQRKLCCSMTRVAELGFISPVAGLLFEAAGSQKLVVATIETTWMTFATLSQWATWLWATFHMLLAAFRGKRPRQWLSDHFCGIQLLLYAWYLSVA